jgi:hypothetical protein
MNEARIIKIQMVKDFIKRVKCFDKEEANCFFGEDFSFELNNLSRLNNAELDYVINNESQILSDKELLWDF